jgi:hypothetical protein
MAFLSHPHGILADYGTLGAHLTDDNAYVDAGVVSCQIFQTKHLSFTGTTRDIDVRVLGSIDGGATYPMTAESEFTVTAGAAPTSKTITTYFTNLKVQAKPAADGQHGTLATQWAGASF